MNEICDTPRFNKAILAACHMSQLAKEPMQCSCPLPLVTVTGYVLHRQLPVGLNRGKFNTAVLYVDFHNAYGMARNKRALVRNLSGIFARPDICQCLCIPFHTYDDCTTTVQEPLTAKHTVSTCEHIYSKLSDIYGLNCI